MVPPPSHRIPRVLWYSGSPPLNAHFAYRTVTSFGAAFQRSSPRALSVSPGPYPEGPQTSGLGSFPFARRYSENRCFFLFLRLLRCFTSPGSPASTMYSCMRDTLSCAGFPHSDIRGSMLAYSSPRLFAVNHVLLRLLVPRHPPCALISLILTDSLITYA